jgi:hypothetical protein
METKTKGRLREAVGAVSPCAQDDDYIPTGLIPDVIRGGTRNLQDGCYTFGDIVDLAAHHLVSTGEARAVEAQLRVGVTVREFLRTRYGVACGPSERGDWSDLKRFGLWMADARLRLRRLRAEERIRRAVQLRRAWRARTPAKVM